MTSISPSQFAAVDAEAVLHKKLYKRLVLISLIILGLMSCVLAYAIGRQAGLERLYEQGQQIVDLQERTLEAALDPFAYVAVELSRRPDVIAFFTGANEGNVPEGVRQFLLTTAAMSGSDTIFLVNRDGVVFATSRQDDAPRRVGQNVRERLSVMRAMQGQLGRHHDIDFDRRKRVYTIAAPVRHEREIIGAVGLTIDFERIERGWALFPQIVFARDAQNFIMASNREAFHFRTLARSEDENLEETLAGTDVPRLIGFENIGQFSSSEIVRLHDDESARGYLRIERFRPLLNWTLTVLVDTTPAEALAWRYTLFTALFCLMLGVAVMFVIERRARLLERMNTEQAIARMLERKVAERTAMLEEANKRLLTTQKELVQAGKMAGLGQMMATLAHEFNQPIAAIRAYAENGKVFLSRAQEEKVEDTLQRILNLTDRMAALSSHLKNFARKPSEVTQPVDLKKVCEAAIDLVEPHMRAHKVSVALKVPQRRVMVLGGALRLEQVVVNLLTNAADAMAETGGEISVTMTVENGLAILCVRDQGNGVAPEHLEAIFDPFFTTKDVGQGLGLGLSIAYNIARDFGGSLRARNHEDGGAEFTLSLQVAQQKALSQTGETSKPATHKTRKRAG